MGENVTVLAVGDVLLVVVPSALEAAAVLALQEELSEEIVQKAARGVVIDLTGLDFVDTFVGKHLSSIAAAAALLGARPVLVGLRPAVAQTLVHLGIELDGIALARDLEAGLAALRPGGIRSRS
ncbi:STAS domain-containing protein [Streptomyces sp. NPDC056132]|uniref:STAS domain-containing protein n=1 Tax=Streptomyces sp. NPDC056132 TaxID=3345722 RepID=UPI0035D92474